MNVESGAVDYPPTLGTGIAGVHEFISTARVAPIANRVEGWSLDAMQDLPRSLLSRDVRVS